jgi:hypothetical protein
MIMSGGLAVVLGIAILQGDWALVLGCATGATHTHIEGMGRLSIRLVSNEEFKMGSLAAVFVIAVLQGELAGESAGEAATL